MGPPVSEFAWVLRRYTPCYAKDVALLDLLERTRLFSLAVLEFCRQLPDTREAQEAAGQLRRAANSVRNNYRAGRKSRSRKTFVDKLGVAREEADECLDWLEYIRDAGIANEDDLLQEANELTAILTAALKTARRNSRRMKRQGGERSSRG